MAREDLHFRLRIPEDLKEKIAAAAVESRRSMTAEIINRLDWSLEWFEADNKDAATLVRELKSKLAAEEAENARLRERLYSIEGLVPPGIAEGGHDAGETTPDIQRELSFIDEIDEIQQRLYRLRMTQMKASLNESERRKDDD